MEIACNQWEGVASIQAPQLFNLGFRGMGEGVMNVASVAAIFASNAGNFNL